MKRHFFLASVCLAAGACAPALASEISTVDGIVQGLPRFLGRLHPVVVHFPIALLAAAVLFEAVSLLFKRERAKPSAAGLACVAIGAVGAGVAAWAGWINADLEPHGKGVADLMFVHRWLGITTAGLAAIALVGGILGATGKAKGMTGLYRIAIVLAAGMVSVTGHWGGSMVYGEGYLTEVLFPEPPVVEPDIESQLAELEASGTALTVDFATQIAPIFSDHCIKCHGPTKRKGNLRLDARRYVFDDRDADAQVIIPGDALDSEVHFRIALDRDDEDAMPPEGKGDPLTPEEVTLVETWINEGAFWTDVPMVAPVVGVAEGGDSSEGTPAEPAFVFDDDARAAQAEAFAALLARGAVVGRLAADQPWAEVRFDLLGESVTDEDLALLDGLVPTLASLNLAGTSITDAGVARLAAFGGLERLHLGRTAVTDDGLASLSGLTELRYLNLYDTAITDRGLVAAAALPALDSLFLWQTGVSPQAGALLSALKPGLTVEVGGTLEPVNFDDVPSLEEVANDDTPAGAEADPPPDGDDAETTVEGAVLEVALLPDCCQAAIEKGGECDHECCVEARLAGLICDPCSG